MRVYEIQCVDVTVCMVVENPIFEPVVSVSVIH